MDVAYVDGSEALQRVKHPLEGDVVLVQAVGNEQPGDLARHFPGPPQQGDGVVLFLGGRDVPRQHKPGGKIHDGHDIRLPAADLLVLLVAAPLVSYARGLEGLRIPFHRLGVMEQCSPGSWLWCPHAP